MITKKQARANKLKKIGMITFMVLIALGFTVPGFLHSADFGGTSAGQVGEPRLCQTDSDCYLTCDGVPRASLCSQNLCMINSCDEPEYYGFEDNPVEFSFSLLIQGEEIDFSSRMHSSNFFVTSSQGKVNVFTQGLSLRHILEKAGIFMNDLCIFLDGQQFCADAEHDLTLTVNGETSAVGPYFIPKTGDVVQLEYGEHKGVN